MGSDASTLPPWTQLAGLALEAPSRRTFRQEAFRRLLGWVGSDGGTMQRLHPPMDPVDDVAFVNVDTTLLQRAMRDYDAVYAKEIEVIASAGRAAGNVVLDVRVLSAHQRSRMAWYADVAVPSAIRESIHCLIPSGPPPGITMGLLNRSTARRARFSDRTLELLRQLMPLLALADSFLSKRDRGLPRPEIPLAQLSRREREIVELLVLGYTNGEIALALGTAAATVRNQLSQIYRKLGATNRGELVGLVLRTV